MDKIIKFIEKTNSFLSIEKELKLSIGGMFFLIPAFVINENTIYIDILCLHVSFKWK